MSDLFHSSCRQAPGPPPASGLYDPSHEHDACGAGQWGDWIVPALDWVVVHRVVLERILDRRADVGDLRGRPGVVGRV